MDVPTLSKLVGNLSNEDYKDLMMDLLMQHRPHAIMKEVKAKAEWAAKRAGKALGPKPGGSSVSGERDTSEWLALQGSEREWSRSAWNTPMIFRGDLVPTGEPIYIDVEKLSLKMKPGDTDHVQVASSVAVVNKEGNIILWAFIKWDNICQTFPSITGITRQKLEIGLPLDLIKPFLEMSFKGNTVVGWNLEGDLKAIMTAEGFKKEDLQNFYYGNTQGNQEQPYKLKDAWNDLIWKKKKDSEKTEEEKSKFQCGVHSAIIDARATRDMHRKMLEYKAENPNLTKCPDPITRVKVPFVHVKTDKCFCPKSKSKKSKQTQFYLPK